MPISYRPGILRRRDRAGSGENAAFLGLPALRQTERNRENMMGTIRSVCRNVAHWRNAAMVLRWTVEAMQEAAKKFRRLSAHKLLPVLPAVLLVIQARQEDDSGVASEAVAAWGRDRQWPSGVFQQRAGHPPQLRGSEGQSIWVISF